MKLHGEPEKRSLIALLNLKGNAHARNAIVRLARPFNAQTLAPSLNYCRSGTRLRTALRIAFCARAYMTRPAPAAHLSIRARNGFEMRGQRERAPLITPARCARVRCPPHFGFVYRKQIKHGVSDFRKRKTRYRITRRNQLSMLMRPRPTTAHSSAETFRIKTFN
ncbi:Hypothetical protein CINCED_3A021563 [Cinara cedri]|uniref:Uncharacterized protein n=1 Tax=Cinara cedri TaxID=506608 RepID=A0A5E4MXY4_9HEMI|nr:Hypothetical protein CINCED_3A021563 [Cinara cedri]